MYYALSPPWGKWWGFKICIYSLFSVWFCYWKMGKRSLLALRSEVRAPWGAEILQDMIPQTWTKALRKSCLNTACWRNQDLLLVKQPPLHFQIYYRPLLRTLSNMNKDHAFCITWNVFPGSVTSADLHPLTLPCLPRRWTGQNCWIQHEYSIISTSEKEKKGKEQEEMQGIFHGIAPFLFGLTGSNALL